MRLLGLLMTFLVTGTLMAQNNEIKMYEQALTYLNDSVLINLPSPSKLAKACEECCVRGSVLSFNRDVQVADRFIENRHGFPISDLFEQNYPLDKDCAKSLRMGLDDCETVNNVMDSLNHFWTGYKPMDRQQLLILLNGLISPKKDGYIVFFSDIYRNTIAAELKEFCSSYEQSIWQGASTSFFFVFNKNGGLEKVYSAKMIHYN